MHIRFSVIVICGAIMFSACQKISETDPVTSEIVLPSVSVTEITPDTESTVISPAETTSLTAETAAENETLPVTAISDTDTTYSETSQTETFSETMTDVTTVSVTEISSEKIVSSETSIVSSAATTALTIQPESPYDPEYDKSLPSPSSNSYIALEYGEQKGIWISYLEYMSILKNRSETQFGNSIAEYFDNISALGYNTVYVQVRAFGDAYYDSEIFPSGEQYNGTIGAESGFDALSVMVKTAHEKGLSIHAWVNPMRLMTSEQFNGIIGGYPIKKWYDSDELRGKYIVEYGGRWYLDPAYDEVTDLVADGIKEILLNYDVDGIQIDDYFYPTEDAAFDSRSYAESGTGLSLSEWRISNINKMVRKLYDTVHSANPTAVFGISPQGSIENDYKGSADVRTWCSQSGYCDYILPQVYFGFENAALPYSDVISEWSGMVKNPYVRLVIGLAAYKIGAADNYAGESGKNEWIENNDIISRETELAKSLGNYGGIALYRYESVFAPSPDVAEAVSKEIENIKK